MVDTEGDEEGDNVAVGLDVYLKKEVFQHNETGELFSLSASTGDVVERLSDEMAFVRVIEWYGIEMGGG